MFGISGAEFCVIILVAILVIPAKNWPDVARFLARVVRAIRAIVWRITDASEKIREQIDLEKPIDDLIRTTTDDVLSGISEPRETSRRGRPRKNTGGTRK